MKILFVASELPYPPNSGTRLRNYHLLRHLAGRHRITVAAHGSLSQASGAAELAKLGLEVRLVAPITRTYWRELAQAACCLAVGRPLLVARHRSRERAAAIARAAEEGYHLVQLDAVGMADRLTDPNLPVLITEDDIESEIWRQTARTRRNPLTRALLWWEAGKLARFEGAALLRFPSVVVSELDRRRLRERFGAQRCWVVPNGVDVEHFAGFPSQPEPDLLVYTGAMDYRPNQDAMAHFIRRILPLVWRERPSVRLAVVGRRPSGWLSELAAREPRIEVTGEVEDVRPFLARATALVVPLRIGGGTRLKILEALAMGRAVISTGVGAEGLDLEPERHLLLADSPGDFAQAVLRVLSDPELARRLGEAGQELVRRQYDWSLMADRLEKVWREVAGEGGGV